MGARAVQLLLRCPHTPRLHRQSRMLASALPVEGDGRSPKIDEVIKRKLYERYGVQEYWIVDPELEIIKVFRMTEQGYIRSAELSNEARDTLTTPLLPDLQIPLGEIFE
ncbi:MAG: Uma2 family endonuclease [Nitrospirae bacterium]|nr:Uma2 family endonuclease [Nitrospirota bacterium]